jgi:hypothetical protein
MKFNINGKEIEVEDAVLQTALEKKEAVTLTNDALVLRTKEEDEQYKVNLRSEAKNTGVEIAIKEWRDKLGLDFQGKTMENFTEALKNKVLTDAKIEPEEKLKNTLKDMETLKQTIQSVQSEKEKVVNEFSSFKNNFVVQSELSKVLPQNTIIPQDDILTIVKNKFEFAVNEGKIEVKQNGEVLKNPTTLDPLPVKDVIDKFFIDNPTYLKPVAGGSGAGDSGAGGSKQTLDKFIGEMQEKGIALNSAQFNSEYEARVKAGLLEA